LPLTNYGLITETSVIIYASFIGRAACVVPTSKEFWVVMAIFR